MQKTVAEERLETLESTMARTRFKIQQDIGRLEDKLKKISEEVRQGYDPFNTQLAAHAETIHYLLGILENQQNLKRDLEWIIDDQA